ncbi:MAG: helix-turn-helix domain-containing protein [Chloroflexota bacterium]|nr:helix-turn-helix domain-containing protein [Chloroflexota bacterium]
MKREPRLSELRSVTQAAAMLGVSPDALHMSIGRKKLHAEHIGVHLVLTLQEIERYRRENSRGGASVAKEENE